MNGHRRGLVDVMPGFGVKTPLKREIVTNDFMFHTAADLFEFLVHHFEKGKVHYKLHKKVVYISPGKIFCPVVAISKDLTLSNGDYLFLIDTLSRHT